MIVLNKFVSAWGMPDLSPFCIKVETYLRMAGLPFQSRVADARSAPKGKLPYIDDGGTLIADSRDIIAHLEAKLPRPIDAGLSSSERALSTMFRALFESELYFCGLYLRWQMDDGWHAYQSALREYASRIGTPSLLQPLILRSVRKKLVRDLWGQGTGRHTREAVEAQARESLDATSVQLGTGPYLLGATPRTIDATVHAFLWSLLDAPFESPIRDHARKLSNLVEYKERLRAQFYADASPARERESGTRLGSAA